MKMRKRLSRGRSKRLFRRTAGASKLNIQPPVMRGGVRL